MIFTAIVICAVLILGLFIGVPYYQAYQRRVDLARREQQEKENNQQGEGVKSTNEQPKK